VFLDIFIEDDTMIKLCLIEIEKLMLSNRRSLKEFKSIQMILDEYFDMYGNVLLFNELNYHVNEMQPLFDEQVVMLNEDKKNMYDHVVYASIYKYTSQVSFKTFFPIQLLVSVQFYFLMSILFFASFLFKFYF